MGQNGALPEQGVVRGPSESGEADHVEVAVGSHRYGDEEDIDDYEDYYEEIEEDLSDGNSVFENVQQISFEKND